MTTTLTIDAVRAWRPEALAEAAIGVGKAHEAVDAEVKAAQRIVYVKQGIGTTITTGKSNPK